MSSRGIVLSLLVAASLALGYGVLSVAGPQAGGSTQVASIRTVGPSDGLVLPQPLATPSAENRSNVIG